MPCFEYTFLVQCREYVNHAHSRIIATVRIENDVSGFMKALEDLNKNKEFIKDIDVGEINFESFLAVDKE